MPSFSLYEPHPHTPAHATPFGRGGAGNLTTSSRPTNLPPPPSALTQNARAATHSAKSNKPYHTGRGGAGNMRPADDERRLFSFDEELERDDRKKDAARVPVYHIGRGGSGNAIHAGRTDGSLSTQGGVRRNSNGSSGSNASSENRKGVAGLLKGLAGRRAS